jgi:hypothetical protein
MMTRFWYLFPLMLWPHQPRDPDPGTITFVALNGCSNFAVGAA